MLLSLNSYIKICTFISEMQYAGIFLLGDCIGGRIFQWNCSTTLKSALQSASSLCISLKHKAIRIGSKILKSSTVHASSQNYCFPQVLQYNVIVLRFPCLNKWGKLLLLWHFFFFLFSFQRSTSVEFCLFCHLSWKIMKHFIEFSNEHFCFE